ncbi:hypothetical protein CC1G_09930 [Coprinopsis cinerea okayama7|uniref:Uncharacterized protein n=1 Tax=Coprinopsis cinerea (strain Okayama-7 / 130 / ATCC MYA-4618 / FGSC 9003) TaxID=240176 RepID=A8NN23_COPC7|nr:hypothetical protein CC1G_09930 [Coprinopsis cinerea okayama7\|eukprot:XP_001835039.1 hypothetical protein CC1G_09930 [Coprinopsis cinerea okayama7\
MFTIRLTVPPLPPWDDKTERSPEFESGKLPNLTFDYIHGRGKGIRLSDLLHGRDAQWLAPKMIDGTAPVFSSVMSHITLYVYWPGYDENTTEDMTDIPLNVTTITRAELARIVGVIISTFIRNRQAGSLKGTKPEWDLSSVELQDVFVSGIRHVFGHVYHAVIHIEKQT